MNGGHGHVTPRPDGQKARCGGPKICRVCAIELAAQGGSTEQNKADQWAEIGRQIDELREVAQRHGCPLGADLIPWACREIERLHGQVKS